MKFISVHYKQQTPGLWSGIPHSIVEGLRQLGHEVVIVDDLHPYSSLWTSMKRVVYKRVFGRDYDRNRDPHFVKQRAVELNRRIAAIGPVDALLFTSLPDAAYAETRYPLFVIHDTSWAGLDGYYIRPGQLADETLAGGYTLDKLAVQRSAGAVFCTQWAVDAVVKSYGVAPEKIHSIPMGANHAPPRSEVEAGLACRGRGPIKMLFVGQEWGRKGGPAALDICRAIERRGVPVELAVVGCIPPSPVPAFVRSLARLDRSIPEQKAAFDKLFRESDFFLLPTRAEAYGLVFAEAAAFGLPCITSDTGGVTGVAGPAWSLALPLDSPPEQFAAWAIEKFQDRASYERMAWAAREDFEQRLNWPAFCGALVELTQQVLAKTAASTPMQEEELVR